MILHTEIMEISVCKIMVKPPFETPAQCVINSYMYSHVFVEPAEHVCPCLLDAGLVCGVDVLSLAVDKPMSLTRKDLHLVIHCALLLQLCFENTHLRSKIVQAQIMAFESAISAFILTKKMFKCWCILTSAAYLLRTNLLQRDNFIFFPKDE